MSLHDGADIDDLPDCSTPYLSALGPKENGRPVAVAISEKNVVSPIFRAVFSSRRPHPWVRLQRHLG